MFWFFRLWKKFLYKTKKKIFRRKFSQIIKRYLKGITFAMNRGHKQNRKDREPENIISVQDQSYSDVHIFR